MVELDKHGVKINRTGDSQEQKRGRRNGKRRLITGRYRFLQIRFCQNEKKDAEDGDHQRAGPDVEPADKQVPDFPHMEPVLFIEEILLPAVHCGDDGQGVPLAPEIGHHLPGHIHGVVHGHIKV